MIIGMRGHDFGRMEPDRLAEAIASHGYRATQLAFGKAFVQSPETYMTEEGLASVREAFAAGGIAVPVMGCYVSASDSDPDKLAAAKSAYADALRASVLLGADVVGTETTHFTFEEAEREAAYARLLDFTRSAVAAETAKPISSVMGMTRASQGAVIISSESRPCSLRT